MCNSKAGFVSAKFTRDKLRGRRRIIRILDFPTISKRSRSYPTVFRQFLWKRCCSTPDLWVRHVTLVLLCPSPPPPPPHCCTTLQNHWKKGTHCVHVGSAVHALRTCLFTDTHSLTHSLTHSYMPDDIVSRALYSALPTTTEYPQTFRDRDDISIVY